MKTNVTMPAGVGCWQVDCDDCGAHFAVLIGLVEGQVELDEHRPRLCCFCAHRVRTRNALQQQPAAAA